MNCPGCGMVLIGGITVCPKCKYDTRAEGGGEVFKEKQKHLRDESEKRVAELAKQYSGESLGIPDLVYRINGARGRSIDVYPYKCIITTGVTIGSILTHNATDGEKTIYYQDCVGLQVKYPKLTLGYIQFETAASTQNNITSNFFNENTFTYDPSQIPTHVMSVVVEYIKAQLDKIKEAQRNSWMK